MTEDPGALFDTAPPPPPLTPGEQRRKRVLACVQSGSHPLALVLGAYPALSLHPSAVRTVPATGGPTCGTCAHRVNAHGGARAYPKCGLDWPDRATHGEATDIRAHWPACAGWTERSTT